MRVADRRALVPQMGHCAVGESGKRRKEEKEKRRIGKRVGVVGAMTIQREERYIVFGRDSDVEVYLKMTECR